MKNILLKFVSLIILISVSACGVFDTKSFDSEIWKKGNIRERGQMAKSLERSNLLQGKTKDEVIMLLGKPDSKDSLNEIHYKVDIGHKFGSEPWVYSFSISFDDETQKVEKAYLHD